MAHNFKDYDSYFILQYLRKNCVHYDVIICGANVLSVDMLKIVSLNFIPMCLANFPKTFGLNELAKGHFHIFSIRKKISTT